MFYCEFVLAQTRFVFFFLKGLQEAAVPLYFGDCRLQSLASLLVSLCLCGKDPSRQGASQISAHIYELHCCREKHRVMEVQLSKNACVHSAFRERPRERGQGKDIPELNPVLHSVPSSFILCIPDSPFRQEPTNALINC